MYIIFSILIKYKIELAKINILFFILTRFSIYSPELVTTQQELFEALKFKDSNPAIVDAARAKLR